MYYKSFNCTRRGEGVGLLLCLSLFVGIMARARLLVVDAIECINTFACTCVWGRLHEFRIAV